MSDDVNGSVRIDADKHIGMQGGKIRLGILWKAFGPHKFRVVARAEYERSY